MFISEHFIKSHCKFDFVHLRQHVDDIVKFWRNEEKKKFAFSRFFGSQTSREVLFFFTKKITEHQPWTSIFYHFHSFNVLLDRTSKLSRVSTVLRKIARLIYSLFVFIFRSILWDGTISDLIVKRNFELEPQSEFQLIPCSACVILLLCYAYIYFLRVIPPCTVNFNPNVWKND